MQYKSIYYLLSICLLIAIANACTTAQEKIKPDDFRSLIPAFVKDTFYLSPENQYSSAKAKLGRYFFYDRRMSVNQTKACATCHAPEFSFTDSYRRSIGALGDNVQHNAPPIINIVFNKYLTAADSSLHFPEQQINNPMFHNKPVELGWEGNQIIILSRLKKDSLYNSELHLLFPNDKDPFTIKNIQDCISNFVKTIVSFNSSYDRYVSNNDTPALSPAQQRGMQLFFSDKLHCNSCHGGINFSAPSVKDKNGVAAYYQNTGLYNIDNKGSYPETDNGLFEFTKQQADIGKYRIPTLRNLAFTAPYLHDGSAASLNDVISIYENGGRNNTTGLHIGDGRTNPYKSPLIAGFVINGQQKKDLISFLLSLSDSSVCTNKAFSNPFLKDETRQ